MAKEWPNQTRIHILEWSLQGPDSISIETLWTAQKKQDCARNLPHQFCQDDWLKIQSEMDEKHLNYIDMANWQNITPVCIFLQQQIWWYFEKTRNNVVRVPLLK